MGKHHDRRTVFRTTQGEPLSRVIHRPDSESDDRGLVDAFLSARDDVSFRALYRRHTPALYALASRMTNDEVEGLVQDAWVRAIERLDSFRWASSLRTWLVAIMVNCFRERNRRARRHTANAITDNLPDPRAPEPGRQLDIEGAIVTLPPGYREIFVLHDIEGYPHADIAVMLGIAEGTSKSQLSRARAAIRRHMLSDLNPRGSIGPARGEGRYAHD